MKNAVPDEDQECGKHERKNHQFDIPGELLVMRGVNRGRILLLSMGRTRALFGPLDGLLRRHRMKRLVGQVTHQKLGGTGDVNRDGN